LVKLLMQIIYIRGSNAPIKELVIVNPVFAHVFLDMMALLANVLFAHITAMVVVIATPREFLLRKPCASTQHHGIHRKLLAVFVMLVTVVHLVNYKNARLVKILLMVMEMSLAGTAQAVVFATTVQAFAHALQASLATGVNTKQLWHNSIVIIKYPAMISAALF